MDAAVIELALGVLKEVLTLIRLEVEATPLEVRQQLARQRFEDFMRLRRALGFKDE